MVLRLVSLGVDMVDALLTEHEVSRVIGRAVSTLQKDRVEGRGVPFVRVGRLVRYRESDVQAYIEGLVTRLTTGD